MKTLDFSRSFLTFQIDLQKQKAITLSHQPPTTLNNGRVQLECRCEMTNQQSGEKTTYVLGASCKTEQVGADGDLWLTPNGDFCPIVCDDEFLIIKSWQKCDMGVMRNPPSLGAQPERQSGVVKEAWMWLRVHQHEIEGELLEDFDAIFDATISHKALVSRTEYSDGGYDICIEHPVKTMNVTDRERVYQTDTGPIILPNFAREVERTIEYFELAFAAFNAPDWTEFVVNIPTPLSDEISVNHYSQTRRIENTRNSLIALA